MKRTTIFCLAISLVLGMFQETIATISKGETDGMHFQDVKIALAGTAKTKADYFAAKSARSVILAPGAMFSNESWHFLAERFQNSGSTPDLLNAIAFLKAKGAKEIAIVGASAGGAGVLYTLRDAPDQLVDKVVLLAPAGGAPLLIDKIRKLFIVAEDDMISSNAEVYKLYINSSDHKLYKEFKGSEHANRLFDSKHRENIIQMMIHFIEN